MRTKTLRNFIKIVIIASTFTFIWIPGPVLAQVAKKKETKKKEKPRLAILDLKAKEGVSKSMAGIFSDLIRSGMVKTKLFIVVDRSSIQAILKEQSFQQSGCTDTACAVQLGRLLAANKIMLGNIAKVGKRFIVTINIVDVSKAQIDFSDSATASDPTKIEETSENLARKIGARIMGIEDVFITRKKKSRFPNIWRSALLPGWGQYHDGSKIRGYIYMASAAFLGLYTYSRYTKYISAEDAYNGTIGVGLFTATLSQLPTSYLIDTSLYNDKRNTYEKQSKQLNFSAALLSLFWVWNIIDAGIFKRTQKKALTDKPSISPHFSIKYHPERRSKSYYFSVRIVF